MAVTHLINNQYLVALQQQLSRSCAIAEPLHSLHRAGGWISSLNIIQLHRQAHTQHALHKLFVTDRTAAASAIVPTTQAHT